MSRTTISVAEWQNIREAFKVHVCEATDVTSCGHSNNGAPDGIPAARGSFFGGGHPAVTCRLEQRRETAAAESRLPTAGPRRCSRPFYAGHGVANHGVNFAVPSDVPAVIEGAKMPVCRASIWSRTLVSGIQARGPRVMMLVLDACRDDPFGSVRRVVGRTIGMSRGLAEAKVARGVFTLCSAGIGQTALDRLGPDVTDRNSVLTRVFVDRPQRPGVHLTDFVVCEEL